MGFDKAVAGEYEVMDVAVDEILKAPGESAYLVDGVPETAY